MLEPVPPSTMLANAKARVQDASISWNHDLATMVGLVRACEAVLCLEQAGAFWLGFPCNSMVWMSRSYFRRSPTNPFGDVSRTWFWNKIILRGVFLAVVATVRGVYMGVEQPLSSLLRYVPHLHMLSALTCKQWHHIVMHLISILENFEFFVAIQLCVSQQVPYM